MSGQPRVGWSAALSQTPSDHGKIQYTQRQLFACLILKETPSKKKTKGNLPQEVLLLFETLTTRIAVLPPLAAGRSAASGG